MTLNQKEWFWALPTVTDRSLVANLCYKDLYQKFLNDKVIKTKAEDNSRW